MDLIKVDVVGWQAFEAVIQGYFDILAIDSSASPNLVDDTLNGDKGNDFLLGDAGFDILTGGGGTDTFIIKILVVIPIIAGCHPKKNQAFMPIHARVCHNCSQFCQSSRNFKLH